MIKQSHLIILFSTFSLLQFSIFYFFTTFQKKIDFLESQVALLERKILNAQLRLDLTPTQVENDSFLTIVAPYVPYVIGAVCLVVLWYFCSYSGSDSSSPGAGGGGFNLASQSSVEPNSIITPDVIQESLISKDATSSFLNVVEGANSSIGDPLLSNIPSSGNANPLLDAFNRYFNLSDAESIERFEQALSNLFLDNGGTATIGQLRALCRDFGMTPEQISALEPYILKLAVKSQPIIETALSQI